MSGPFEGYRFTVNVREFGGAVGNGTNNDAPQILAALNVLASRVTYKNKGILYLPAGRYRTLSALMCSHPYIRIVGDGPGKTIIAPDTGWVSVNTPTGGGTFAGAIGFCGVDGGEIEGITVDAYTSTLKSNGIIHVPDGLNGAGTVCTNGRVQDCEVFCIPEHTYSIWSQRSQHHKIINNFVNGNQTSYVPDGDPSKADEQEGIEIFGGLDVLVHGNTVKNVGGGGLFINSVIGTTPNSWNRGIRITDNYVKTASRAIRANTSYHATNGDGYLKDVTISGNQVEDFFTLGVGTQHTQSNTSVENLTISGNTMRGCALSAGHASVHGIGLDNQGTTFASCRNVKVENNQAVDVPTTTASAGVNYVNKYKNLEWINNDLSQAASLLAAGDTYGLYVNNCDHFEVVGGKIDGTRSCSVNYNNCTDFRQYGGFMQNFNQNGTGVSAVQVAGTSSKFEIRNVLCQSSNLTSVAKLVNVGASSDVGWIEGVRYLDGTYAQQTVLWGPATTNTNTGTFTATAASATYQVTNSLCIPGMQILLTQEAGAAALAIKSAVRNATGFLVTFTGPAVGDEVFRWSLRR